MSSEKASSRRDTPDQRDDEEAQTPPHAVDERTAAVLEDTDDLIREIDDALFGDIMDEHARDRYAEDTTRAFVQKGGQ